MKTLSGEHINSNELFRYAALLEKDRNNERFGLASKIENANISYYFNSSLAYPFIKRSLRDAFIDSRKFLLQEMQLPLFPKSLLDSIHEMKTASVIFTANDLMEHNHCSSQLIFAALHDLFLNSQSSYKLNKAMIDLTTFSSFMKTFSEEAIGNLLCKYIPRINKYI